LKTSTLSKAIAAAALAIAGSAHAATTVIDFEALSNTGFPYYTAVSSYAEDGYKLTVSSGFINLLFAPSTDNALQYAGSTTAFAAVGDKVKLARADGAAFDFTSIDLTKLSVANPGGNSITFTGNYLAGGSVSKTVAIDTAFGLHTYNSFAGFTGLKSVTWTENFNVVKDYQFDNINVTAVPEPETYAMLGAGLGLLAFMGRRKKA
jgi:hypothetical protein